ncbi:MAG TPA: alpha/beta hydrolase-fold protein [Actinocrinis sp.]|uniref:alpha/beta hydrolase n=1 Tax=Actinocrinis sp. TaxID=1920516 RepID=UPI002D6AB5FD|nr:alpha/beta hydrolase-fold protein [Actinocrinis sp.]HZU58079.1 alpha/beta hydrolase-fold protein [Actinocrinis sp.]
MGLTSGFFLDAVIAAVIALPLVTVLLWGRLRGPRVIRQLQRLVLIALCQGVAVLLAALMINNSYQLYTSWSDLFGHNGPSGQIQAAKPVSLTSAQARSVDRPLPNAALFHPDSQMPGEVHAVITGAQSKVTGDVVVWLPPQYNQRQYAHTDFPVIQLLSGYPGSPGSWFRSLKVTDVLAAEVQRLAARPVILVGAAINVDPPHNPDCSDIPGGPRVATWLAHDVRDLINSSFRTITDRSGWGLMGYSEGGLCASKLLLQYPNEFAAAVSMSGDDHPDGDLLKPGTAAYDENSPLWLLQHRPAPNVALLLTGTLQDGSTAAEANEMSLAAKAPTVVERIISARGGHNAGVWKAAEPATLDWLTTHLGQPPKSGVPAVPNLSGVTGAGSAAGAWARG